MTNNYYQVLGLSQGASIEEIRNAYRSLARKHHPDVDKSPGAEARFKEINEAYQVLSDPKKKELYDEVGHEAFKRRPTGAQDPFGGMRTGGWGPFTYSYSTGSPGSSDFGSVDPFDIFESVFGFRGFRKESRGRDLNFIMDVDFMEAIKGETRMVEINGRRLAVKIPPGARSGTKIKFSGLGETPTQEAKTTPSGDLYITLRVSSHPTFYREADDIYSEKILTFSQLALGDTIEVATVQGEVKLKVPSGTQSGAEFRLRGKGVKTRFGSGDHYVRIGLRVPKSPTGREKSLLEELKRVGL